VARSISAFYGGILSSCSPVCVQFSGIRLLPPLDPGLGRFRVSDVASVLVSEVANLAVASVSVLHALVSIEAVEAFELTAFVASFHPVIVPNKCFSRQG
jgi:hypothetical protein